MPIILFAFYKAYRVRIEFENFDGSNASTPVFPLNEFLRDNVAQRFRQPAANRLLFIRRKRCAETIHSLDSIHSIQNGSGKKKEAKKEAASVEEKVVAEKSAPAKAKKAAPKKAAPKAASKAKTKAEAGKSEKKKEDKKTTK